MAEQVGKEVGPKVVDITTSASITGAVAKTQKEFLHCPQCGEKLTPGSKFCSKCGRSF